MTKINKICAAFFSMVSLAACNKEVNSPAEKNAAGNKQIEELAGRDNGSNRGHVYTLSNQTNGNKVLDYTRNNGGQLSLSAEYSTGGTGTGGGLGNQGAVILTDDNDVLLAVNPGSNTISSFKITGNGLLLKSTVSSGGMRPVSITEHNGVVYVLNAGGSGNISGFELKSNEKLMPIANSTRALSTATAGAAQVSFVQNGNVLVVTEKATNKIITYKINEAGQPTIMHSIIAANPTPFGFAVGKSGNIYVSEAAGGAPGASTVSSYHVGYDGSITLADGPVGAGETAACWVVLTGDGKFGYATNTASNTISSFTINPYSANLGVLQAVAATTQMGPIDAAITNNSVYLYVLNAGDHSIGAYKIAANGSLSFVQTMMGIPTGATGLAAR